MGHSPLPDSACWAPWDLQGGHRQGKSNTSSPSPCLCPCCHTKCVVSESGEDWMAAKTEKDLVEAAECGQDTAKGEHW